MPTSGDNRATFSVQVKAEGQGELDRLAQEHARLSREAAKVKAEFVQCATTAVEYKAALGPLRSALGFVEKMQDAVITSSKSLEAQAEKLAAATEKAALAQVAAYQKAATEAKAASDKISEALQKEASDAEKAAAREAKAADDAVQREMAAFEKLMAERQAISDKINAMLAKDEAAEAKAAAATEKAALQKVGAYEKSAREAKAASDKINAALANDAAEATEAAAKWQENLRRNSAALERDLTAGMVPLSHLQVDAANLGEKLEKGTDSTKKFGSGVLQASYAIQDMQYGIKNATNNIPGFVMALGGGAGLAGGLMLAAVAFDLVLPKLQSLAKDLGLIEDPAQRAMTGIEGLIDVVKELEDKKVKLSYDYSDLRNARTELEKLKAEESAFQDLKNSRKTIQEKVGKAAKDAIVEHGGGTDEESSAQNLAKILEGTQRRAGTFAKGKETVGMQQGMADLQERLGRVQESLANPVSDDRFQVDLGFEKDLKEQMKVLQAKIDESGRKAIEGLLGRAKLGIASAVDEIAAAMDQAPDLFGEGAGGAGARPVAKDLRGALELAKPANIKMAEEHDKETKFQVGVMGEETDRAKKAEALRLQIKAQADEGNAAAGRDRDQSIQSNITTFGADKALGGRLGDDITRSIAGGKSVHNAKAELMQKTMGLLKAGGVPEDLTDEVARGILAKIAEKTMAGLVGMGDNVQAAARASIGADQEKAAGKAAVAGKKEAKGAQVAQQQRIARQIMVQADGGLSPQQAMVGAQHYQQQVAQGENPAMAAQKVMAEMAKHLQQNIAVAQQASAMMGQMVQMIGGANAQLGQVQAQQGMLRGQMGQQRNQRAFPFPTVPGG